MYHFCVVALPDVDDSTMRFFLGPLIECSKNLSIINKNILDFPDLAIRVTLCRDLAGWHGLYHLELCLNLIQYQR